MNITCIRYDPFSRPLNKSDSLIETTVSTWLYSLTSR